MVGVKRRPPAPDVMSTSSLSEFASRRTTGPMDMKISTAISA